MTKGEQVLTGLLYLFIGAALGVVLCAIIEVHSTPAPVQPTCDDGWSTQEEDGKIYKTYIPANDTCKE